MIRKNILFSVSFLLILFLCSCVKKDSRSFSKNLSSSNDSKGKLVKIKKSDYSSSNAYGLGEYNLTTQEKDEVISESNHNMPINYENETAKYDADVQRNHGLTNKEMVKIEREDRRNTFNKTRPSGNHEYHNDFPTYGSQPFSRNY